MLRLDALLAWIRYECTEERLKSVPATVDPVDAVADVHRACSPSKVSMADTSLLTATDLETQMRSTCQTGKES